jgi:hypothetical protein
MAVAEVKFDALGKRWSFRLGFGALCSLEEEFDLPFLQIVQRVFPDLTTSDLINPEKLMGDVANVRLTDLRSVFLAGLEGDQPSTSTKDVEAIIDEIGLDEAGSLLRRAMTNDLGGGETAENPTKGRRRK